MEFEAEPPRVPLISLTPLIDVVFILLVFFMLASSFLDWRAVDLKIASAGNAASSQARSFVIRIPADGTFDVAGQRLTLDEMTLLVEDRLSEQPDLRVLVAPSGGVALQSAVDVLQRLNRLGADNVSLIGQRSNQ